MNHYAARVAPLLVAAFPEQAEGIRIDDDGDLSLEIACPSGSVDAGLSIVTWNEDVVVAFHTHHVHYSDWYGTGTDDHIDAAIDGARRVLAEQLVAVSWYRRGELSGSCWEVPEDAPTKQRSMIANGNDGWLQRRRARHGTIRSWNGTYDSDSTERD